MKKLIYLTLALLILSSCKIQNELYSKKELESENFKSHEWFILKDGTRVAELESIEWELYRGKLYREINKDNFIK